MFFFSLNTPRISVINPNVIVSLISIITESKDLISQFFDLLISKFTSESHLVKSVQIWGFFWSVFFGILIECEDLLRQSKHSVQIKENTGQEKLHIWILFTQC